MGGLLKLFGGNVQLYAAFALVLVLATVSAGYFYQRGEAIQARDQVSALNLQLVGAKDALVVNARAVTDLQAGLNLWKAGAQEATAAQVVLVNRLNAQQLALDQRQVKLHATEKTDNGRPDCGKFLALDLGAACPGHVDAIRVRGTATPVDLPRPGSAGASPHAGTP